MPELLLALVFPWAEVQRSSHFVEVCLSHVRTRAATVGTKKFCRQRVPSLVHRHVLPAVYSEPTKAQPGYLRKRDGNSRFRVTGNAVQEQPFPSYENIGYQDSWLR